MEKHQLVTLLLVSNSKKYYGFIQWTIWLILPVVIRLSQRLSHACLSTSTCIVKLRMAHYISYSLFDKAHYLDNRSNSRANTCKTPRQRCIY